MKRKKTDLPESEWRFSGLQDTDWAPACHFEYYRETIRQHLPRSRIPRSWLQLTDKERQYLVEGKRAGETYHGPALTQAPNLTKPGLSIGMDGDINEVRHGELLVSDVLRMLDAGLLRVAYTFEINWNAPKDEIVKEFSKWLDSNYGLTQTVLGRRGRGPRFKAALTDLVIFRFSRAGFTSRQAEQILTQPGNEWIISQRSGAFTKSRFSEARKRVSERLRRDFEQSQFYRAQQDWAESLPQPDVPTFIPD